MKGRWEHRMVLLSPAATGPGQVWVAQFYDKGVIERLSVVAWAVCEQIPRDIPNTTSEAADDRDRIGCALVVSGETVECIDTMRILVRPELSSLRYEFIVVDDVS